MKCNLTILSSMFCTAGLLTGTIVSAAPPAGYIDASTYGYNTTDATAALQAAINTGQNVWVPKQSAPWYVTGIDLTKSNQTVLFEPGTVVAAKPGAFTATHARLFTAAHVTNVTLSGYGATFQMNKQDYTQAPYVQSEFRHGIGLYTVHNFQIKGLTIQNTGGDGIDLGVANYDPGAENDNIVIKDVMLKNNYRNGISVISVDGLTIDNATIWNTRGTAPHDGIDFEPDHTNQIIKNVVVKNSIFSNSGYDGMNFSTQFQQAGNLDNILITHNTFYDNDQSGFNTMKAELGIAIKNNLFVRNGLYGAQENDNFDVGPETNPDQSIDYSGFWRNGEWWQGYPSVNGDVFRGPGSVNNTAVSFYSTDINSPYYLYLAPGISSAIAQGADDGTFMGARPVFPEPSTLSLLAISAMLMVARRRAATALKL